MIKGLRILLLGLLIATAFSILPGAAAADGLPVFESCMDDTMTGWVLGGSAVLTSGGADPDGQGWLRLTGVGNDEFGYAYYDTDFHSSYGIVVSFEYTAWGGDGADGISFFLYDGITTSGQFQIGDAGGSLGYANGCGDIPGLSNAYVGIGIDEWGNFAAEDSARCHHGYLQTSKVPDSVTIRGSGNSTGDGDPNSYYYQTTTGTLSQGIDIPGVSSRPSQTGDDYRRVYMTISTDKKLTLSIQFGAGNTPTELIADYDLTTGTGMVPLPDTLKLGFAASTGGSTNYHEIRNISVAIPADLEVTKTDGQTSVAPGDPITYTVVATNNGPNDLRLEYSTGAVFTDTVPADITGVTWTAVASPGSVCGAYSGAGNNIQTTLNLLNGGNATFTIQGTVSPTMSQPLVNTATVTPPMYITDNDLNNNTATDTNDVVPAVVTNAASSVGARTATLNGDLTAMGSASPVDVRFEYGLTTSYGSVTSWQPRDLTGAFSASVSSLQRNTTYHFRAVAAGDGTVNGNDMTFTTGTTPPAVTTNSASDITTNSATLNGNLTDTGGASSVDVYFEYGLNTSYGSETSPQPLSGQGTFSAPISGLEPFKTYHFRAKAVGDGTAIGSDMQFTTLSTPPTVTTDSYSNVATYSATLHGTLSDMGTASSVNVSFEYATDDYYTTHSNTYGQETTPATLTATGSYNQQALNLAPGTLYHFRAKAVGHGNAYGADMTFTTTTDPPEVTTLDATNITLNSARLNGNLTSLGSVIVLDPPNNTVDVTFEWATDDYYTTNGETYNNETSPPWTTEESGTYYFDLSSLSPGTMYHFRAKATGDHGTGNGTDLTFTTISTPPSVTTNTASDVTTTSATLNGDLTDRGTASSVDVTFEWATDAYYTGNDNTYDNETSPPWPMTGTGTFNASLSGLDPNTTYHFRAKAVGHGTVYGADETFTTGCDVTSSASNSGPVCGGNDVTLYGDPYGMSTYHWTGPNSFDSYDQDAIVSPAFAGTYTLEVTDSYGCSDTDTTVVVVNTPPTATASNDGPVCQGQDVQLTGGPDGMSVYSWSGPGSFSSSEQSPIVSPAIAGTYTLTVTDANGCSDSASTIVVVNTLPTATASSNSPVCEGNTINLTGGPGGMSSYSWSGPDSFSSSDRSPSIPNATLAMAGDYILTVTNGGCTSDPATTSVTVNSKPTATASSNSPVCEGNTITLTGGPGGMSSYSWSGPDSFSSSDRSPSIPNATLAMAGDYILTVTDGGCTSDPATTSVTVNSKPTAVATNSGPVSEGEDVTLFGEPDGMSVYHWTGPDDFESYDQDAIVSPAIAGSYILEVTDANSCSDTDTTIVVVTSAPLVITNTASDITTNSATLNGTLTSRGTASSVDVSFEYGIDTSYGQETTPQTLDATGAFSAPISGLDPGTTYHFRAKAVGDGTAYGDDIIFNTGTTPPSVITNTASDITTNSATLNGTLTSRGTASSVDVSFEYGLTTSYGQVTTPQTLIGTGTFSASISGLDPGTTYHFKAKAVGDGTAYGDDMTFTTSSPTPPSVTTNDATDITGSTSVLHGYLDSLGTASSVDVSFEYGIDTSYGQVTTAQTLIDTGTFSAYISGLSSDTTYHFRAKAIGYGTEYGDDMLFTTLPLPPNQPPNVVPGDGAGCVHLPVTLSSGGFSDPDAGDTHDASQWQVRTSTGSYASPVFDSGRDTSHLESISLSIAEIDHDTRYYWRVRYQDSHGLWANWSDETHFVTSDTPESWPDPNSPVEITPDGTEVTYNQVTDDGCTYVARSSVTPAGHSEPETPRIGPFVDITTTATYAGTITVGLPLHGGDYNREARDIKLFHWNGTQWEDVTTWVDTENNIVYGEVPSFSWFYIGGQWVWISTDVPIYPNIYIGIAAAFGVAILGYFIRRRITAHN